MGMCEAPPALAAASLESMAGEQLRAWGGGGDFVLCFPPFVNGPVSSGGRASDGGDSNALTGRMRGEPTGISCPESGWSYLP
jgi:hypothetical protein